MVSGVGEQPLTAGFALAVDTLLCDLLSPANSEPRLRLLRITGSGDSSDNKRRMVPAEQTESFGSFRKLGVPYFGVLILRILLFRVLY